MIAEYIYRAGIALRNPDILIKYDFLLQSQHWTREQLYQHQYFHLAQLIKHAYLHSEYYRMTFDQNHVDPHSVTSLSCLNNIPTITKDELVKYRDKIQISVGSERLFYAETSGSTGKPLVFYRNQEWDAWNRASVFRGYSWYGVKPWDNNGYLWGYNFSLTRRFKTLFFDRLQNRFRLFSYKDEEIDRFIKMLTRASYLSGYSSMIYEVAKRINSSRHPRLRFNLKMIKGTSEKIFDSYQHEVKAAFGKPIISEYGAAETGIIAFECPQGAMHINMETVIVEEINSEILVTNLASKSFPIIRYKLGDYVRLDRDARCACGMEHEIVMEVLGRVGKIIYGRQHQYPSLTLYYVFKNLAVEHELIFNYQGSQSEKGRMELKIEGVLASEKERNLIRRELVKYFSSDLDVDILDGQTLHSRKGKKTDFISTVDPMSH